MKKFICSSWSRFALPGVAALVALAGGPAVGWADTINETFSVTVSPAATLTGLTNDFSGTSVAQFNPADGVLTSISFSLTGSVTWTSTSQAPSLNALADVTPPAGGTSVIQSNIQGIFSRPGTLNLGLSGSASDGFRLAAFTGTDSVTTELIIQDISEPLATETFKTNGSLTGTLTYTYTPVSAVPEPSGLSILLAVGGLLCGARLFDRSKKKETRAPILLTHLGHSSLHQQVANSGSVPTERPNGSNLSIPE